MMILFPLIIIGLFSCLHLPESLLVISVFFWSIPPNIPDTYSCRYSLCKSRHVCSFFHTSSLTGAYLCSFFFLDLAEICQFNKSFQITSIWFVDPIAFLFSISLISILIFIVSFLLLS